jgi:hypothetical protein
VIASLQSACRLLSVWILSFLSCVLVLCGDMNALPHSTVVNYLLEGKFMRICRTQQQDGLASEGLDDLAYNIPIVVFDRKCWCICAAWKLHVWAIQRSATDRIVGEWHFRVPWSIQQHQQPDRCYNQDYQGCWSHRRGIAGVHPRNYTCCRDIAFHCDPERRYCEGTRANDLTTVPSEECVRH